MQQGGAIVAAVDSALPGQRERLRAAMLGLPGIEIHGETRDGRLSNYNVPGA